MYEINKNIETKKSGRGFEVSKGLYKAEFAKIINKKEWPVTFTTGEDSVYFCSKVQSLSYYLPYSDQIIPIEKAQSASGEVDGNKIIYRDIFGNIDIEYQYHETKLKQNIYLTQRARENLPDPVKMNVRARDAYLVVVSEIDFSDTLSAFAVNERPDSLILEKINQIPEHLDIVLKQRKIDSLCLASRMKKISKKDKNGKHLSFKHQGKEKIIFCDRKIRGKYHLLKDFAYP